MDARSTSLAPLPANIVYMFNEIVGYSKNTIKLQNINSDSAGPGAGASQTTVTMPTNSIINLRSLALHATFNGKGVPSTAVAPAAPNAVYALCPRGGLSALAQRVSWAAGGIALDNGPTPYSVIQAIKHTTETSISKNQTDNRVLNNSNIRPWTSGVNEGQVVDLICNEWMGFTEASPCFLDTNLLPELRLTIQWESGDVLPVQYQGTNLGDGPPDGAGLPGGVSYSLTNMFWTIDTVSFSNGLLDNINQRMIAEQGSIPVIYPQYQVFSVDQSGPAGTVRGSASTKCLNRVYGAARLTSYGTNQPPVKCVDNVGFAFNNAFTNFVSAGLTEYQFKVNNAPYPLYREGVLGGFNALVIANDRTYRKESGCLIGSQDTWKDNCFTPCVSFNHPADQRFMSGLDLRSINSQINWDCYGGSGDPRQQMLMTEQTSTMEIGGGRALAVIA